MRLQFEAVGGTIALHRELAGVMKKKLILAFWAVGSTGALVWTCWWIFAIIYTRTINVGALVMLVMGIFCAWQGFRTFNAERNSNRLPKQTTFKEKEP